MNQIQFWILNALAALLGILLLSHVVLTRYANYEQNLFYLKQQEINVDQAYLRNAQAVATAIVTQAAKTGDSSLKNLAIKYDLGTAPAPAPTGGSSTGGTSTGGTSSIPR